MVSQQTGDDGESRGAAVVGDASASRRMAASAAVAIAHVGGPRHAIYYANDTFLRVLGRSREEVEGAGIADVLGAGDEALTRVRETLVMQLEPHFAFATADGSRHRATLLAAPLIDPAEPPGRLVVQLMSTGDDDSAAARELREANEQLLLAGIREQELAEQASRSAIELEQSRQLFFSLVSHDLRGPLSAASITAEALERTIQDDERQQRHARRIRHNLERMDRMVRNLLDAQRIRAGEKLPLHLGEHDLVTIAQDVVADLSMLHGDRFVLSGEESLRGVWSADEVWRAIWNLASNAAKYGAPESPVAVLVEKRGDRALVSVHNEGAAISMAEQQRLFAPFSRTISSQNSAKKNRGWGLGLTLVKGCALAHGGEVSVQSSEAEGTTFTLELPIDARSFVDG